MRNMAPLAPPIDLAHRAWYIAVRTRGFSINYWAVYTTPMERGMDESKQDSYGKKEWQPPVLRKLPIVATAGGKTGGNEGQGVGKGDASRNS